MLEDEREIYNLDRVQMLSTRCSIDLVNIHTAGYVMLYFK